MTSPALQYMVTKWAPLEERNRFSAMFSGSFIGNIICKPISGVLCSLDVAGRWPMVFYVFGVIGAVWCISWHFLVYDSPATHPRISKEERRYIESSIGAHQEKNDLPTPWKDIARCRGLWACYFMYFGIGWNLYTLFIGLPSYMEGVLRYSIMNNALLSSVPYIGACVSSIIFSSILDFLLTNRIVSSLTGLKIINGIAAVIPATALLGVTLAGCDRTWIVLLFALNGVAMGANYIGVTTNLIALAHNFAGTTYGITNSVSNIASILAPYVIGFLTNHKQSRHQWNIVFYISAAISYSTFVAYLLMCSDKEQPWNNLHKNKENEVSSVTDINLFR